MAINVVDGEEIEREAWDRFVDGANNGTIFHKRKFLEYHGDRFADAEHHLAFLKGQALFGVLPLAIFEEEGETVARSPYGASYGGPAFRDCLSYHWASKVVGQLVDELRAAGVERAVFTLPVRQAYATFSATFRHCLQGAGFELAGREVSSVVDLRQKTPVLDMIKYRARRSVRAVEDEGVEVRHRASVEDFWVPLEATFEKHGTDPTHTREEFQDLAERFEDEVSVDVAYMDGEPIAGLGHVQLNERMLMSFYICQRPEFNDVEGTSLLVVEAMRRARENGTAWYNLGTSTDSGEAREGLFQFKEGFGATGAFRETYQLRLDQPE